MSQAEPLAEPEIRPKLLLQEMRTRSHSDWESFTALQQELKRIARVKMRAERPDHTLQPTALVNEAFVKLLKGSVPPDFWTDRNRAVACIVRAMGQILIDHADAYNRHKRGGPKKDRLPIDQSQAREFAEGDVPARVDSALLIRPNQSEEIVAVREALVLLHRTAPRQARVVELLYYGGLTQEEVAATLDLSVESIKLDWRKAKAFLKVTLNNR
jgi:RNA polymerase sigma factor (TIGR02999 family)